MQLNIEDIQAIAEEIQRAQARKKNADGVEPNKSKPDQEAPPTAPNPKSLVSIGVLVVWAVGFLIVLIHLLPYLF